MEKCGSIIEGGYREVHCNLVPVTIATGITTHIIKGTGGDGWRGGSTSWAC